MKFYVKTGTGEIKVLPNHSVGENLKLRDKFGITLENTSESLQSKELLIRNKLAIDDLELNNVNVLSISNLLSLKTKLQKLIKCLIAYVRDVCDSLEKKKKERSLLEWTITSAGIKSEIYTPKVELIDSSVQMKSLASEIFYLDDQMRCKTVELNFYTNHLRCLISELNRFGYNNKFRRNKVETMSSGKELRATDLPKNKGLRVAEDNKPVLLMDPVKATRESVKEAAAKRFVHNETKLRGEGSSSRDFEQLLENLVHWKDAHNEKKWLMNYEIDEYPNNTLKGAERAEKARKLVSTLPALVNNLKTEVAYWEDVKKMQIMFEEFPVLELLCESTVPPQKREAEQQIARENKRMKKDVADGETLCGSKDDTHADVPEDDLTSAIPMNDDQVLTNDDVLGDAVTLDQQEAMRQVCLKLGTRAKEIAQFPGSQPVSLNRENLQLLRQRYYWATWKADGTRYMMLITSAGCFLIDRNFNFRKVQMRFPMNQTNEVLGDTHNLTLLDGEMVIDTLPGTQKKQRRYLIYDLLAINSVSIIEWPFCERWKMLEKEVIEPRNLERQNINQSRNPDYRYDLEPFRVRRKDFWLLSVITKLLKGSIPNLSHEADGLIFQGWDDPYIPHPHEGLLEWKYPEMNSVDFLFEGVDENRQLLYLYDRGKKKLMDGGHVDFKNGEDPSELSGKIIKCSWDPEEQLWNCMHVRVDKSTPDDIDTYWKVMRSIKENITEEDLLEDIREIVLLPMYADRIRNDTKDHSRQHSGPQR